jgi:hypothetical protein
MNRKQWRAAGGLPILSAALLSAIGLLWDGAHSNAAAQASSGSSDGVIVNYDVLNSPPGQQYGEQGGTPAAGITLKKPGLEGRAAPAQPAVVATAGTPPGEPTPMPSQVLMPEPTPPAPAAGVNAAMPPIQAPAQAPAQPAVAAAPAAEAPGTEAPAPEMPAAEATAQQAIEQPAPEVPAATEPAQQQATAETSPAETPPAEAQPTETPTESAAVEPPAVQTPPADTSAETPPAETAPAEAQPEQTPAETPAETPAADAAPVETPPAEAPSAEAPPAETPPAETPPAETPAAEAAPAETPPADAAEQPSEESATEAQPDPNKAAPPVPQGGIRIVFPIEMNDVPVEANAALDDLVTQMQTDESMRIQILCYASGDLETESKARRRSLARCLNIRQYLFKKDIRTTRMEVRALGLKFEGQPADRVDIFPANS